MARRFHLKHAFAGAGVLALALWTALPVYAIQNENATQESTQSNQNTQSTTEGTQSTQGAEGSQSTQTNSDSTQTPEGTQSTQNNQNTDRTDSTQTQGTSHEGTHGTQGQSGTSNQTQTTQTQGDTTQTQSDAMQNTGGQGDQTQTALGGNDRKFVMEASQSGRAEVALGQIAAQRASNDEVKQFARRMVEEHTRANVEMKQMATSLGVQLPPALPGKDARMRDRLQTLSGAEFDRAYMKHMVEDHEKAVRMFQKQANGDNATLKDFASKQLPALQEHLKMAQDIHAKLSAAGTTTEGTGTTTSGTGSTDNNTGTSGSDNTKP